MLIVPIVKIYLVIVDFTSYSQPEGYWQEWFFILQRRCVNMATTSLIDAGVPSNFWGRCHRHDFWRNRPSAVYRYGVPLQFHKLYNEGCKVSSWCKESNIGCFVQQVGVTADEQQIDITVSFLLEELIILLVGRWDTGDHGQCLP